MSATRDLIAAALSLADELDELHKEGRNPATFTPSALSEACARAMCEPDMAERYRHLLADIKQWDISQFMSIPHLLRERMQSALAEGGAG